MTDAQLSGTPSAFLHASIIELIAYRDCRCQAWSSHGRDAFDNAEEQRPEPFPSWTSMDVRVSISVIPLRKVWWMIASLSENFKKSLTRPRPSVNVAAVSKEAAATQ